MSNPPVQAAAPTGAPSPGLRIATLGGVPVYIGRTWPVIAIVVVATFGPNLASARPDLGGAAYGVAALFAVLLLFSVLAHEAAHAVVATRFGYRVNRVVADLWGGHTTYDTADSRPGPSAVVAVVGPLANGVLALAGWLLAPHVTGEMPSILVGAFVWTNAFVALFNLLPGLPLDGGFLVDSLVWRLTGDRNKGLVAAGWCGRVVTLLILAWALLLPLYRGQSPSLFTLAWAAFIGAFLWAGATGAIRSGQARRLLGGIRIDTVWRRAGTLPAQASAAQALALRMSGLGTAVVVLDERGMPVGLVDDAALNGIPEHLRGVTPVTAAMQQQPPGWVVDGSGTDSITPVVAVMQQLGVTAVPVRTPDGLIHGIVSMGDLEAALSPRSGRG